MTPQRAHFWAHRPPVPHNLSNSKPAWEVIRLAHRFLGAIKSGHVGRNGYEPSRRGSEPSKGGVQCQKDEHVASLIQQAQEAAIRPMTFKDLKPHERAMLKAIGRIGEQNYLTDVEIVGGIKNVLAYIESNLNHQRQMR